MNSTFQLAELRKLLKSRSIEELKEKAQYMPKSGLACTANARAIIEEARNFGNSGRALDVNLYPDNEDEGHVYVVLDGMQQSDFALNSAYKQLSVAEVVSRGKDITQELLNAGWKTLM